MNQKKSFTPLEKVHPVRDKSLNVVRERSSLTGFTLIELMIAVSILSVGIVAILRSFLGTVAALDTSTAMISAAGILESKMSEIEEAYFKQGVIEEDNYHGEIALGKRRAVLAITTEPVSFEETEFSLIEEVVHQQRIYQTTITLKWKEAQKEREAVIARYFLSQEKRGEFLD